MAANITDDRIFRAINKAGRVWGNGMSPKVLWTWSTRRLVAPGIDKLASHDLRRTCTRLWHLDGGEGDLVRPGNRPDAPHPGSLTDT